MEDGYACMEGEQVCFALKQSAGRPVARGVVRLGSFKPRPASSPRTTHTSPSAPETSPEPTPSWPTGSGEDPDRDFELDRLKRGREQQVEWDQYREMWANPGQVILWASWAGRGYKLFTDPYRTGEGESLSVGTALHQFLDRHGLPLYGRGGPSYSSFLADHYALFAVPPRPCPVTRLSFYLPVTELRPFLGAYHALSALADPHWDFRKVSWVRELVWAQEIALQLVLGDDPRMYVVPADKEASLEETILHLGAWPDGRAPSCIFDEESQQAKLHDCEMYYRVGAFYQHREMCVAPAERGDCRVRDPARLFFYSVEDEYGVFVLVHRRVL